MVKHDLKKKEIKKNVHRALAVVCQWANERGKQGRLECAVNSCVRLVPEPNCKNMVKINVFLA